VHGAYPAPGMAEFGFLRAALDRFWELREREGRVHELKRQLEDVLASEGAQASLRELQELLALLLYYGTGLEVREIAALRRSEVEPAEMGRFRARLARRAGPPLLQVLPAEASAVLRHLLDRGGDDLVLADPGGAAWSEAEVLDVVQRHASGLLLGEAATEPTFFDHPVVLPTPTRLGAHPRHTGRGVVIAFVDSGFYAHPDLLTPRDRIRAYVDLAGLDRSLYEPHDDAWHGTMTSVACAGSGYLSNGLYRGIAREAELVLVAVGRQGRIHPEDVLAALEWLLEHRARYGIRVVNISLGTEFPDSYRESAVDEAAELLVQAGVVVVAAAGNDPLRPSVPPANAPSVLTVGGLVDKNLPHEMTFVPYRSQYGTTSDGLTKPELCAPGALVAAPILPGTQIFDKARGLYFSRGLTDAELRAELSRRPELGIDPAGLPDDQLRSRLEREVREMKLVGPHYQHVDGTSFAAPIVASVVAQMLEACPGLTPRAVRDVLIHTARPLPHIPRERQGYGLVQAMAAVQAAMSPSLPAHARRSAEPRVDGCSVTFQFPGDAGRVAVSGSFNQWDREGLAMTRGSDGRFQAVVEVPFPDRHTYKFIVDGQYWVEDEANPQTEPDGYGGVNSVFQTTEHHFGGELSLGVFDTLHGAAAEAERASARSVLDFTLGLPNAGWNSAVRAYHVRCLEHVVSRLEAPAPASGIELFQLYNCGIVVRSASARVGIDVVTGRHVWGLDWPMPEDVVRRLIDSLDALLVTQRLPDHLDLDLVRGLLERGRPVVAPEEVHASIGPEVVGMAAGAVRLLEVGEGLEVRAHRAAHWRDPDGRVAQRSYEMRLGGCAILHLADHDHTRFVDFVRPPDVLLATLGHFGPGVSPTASARALVSAVRPGLLVPTHVVELGQPADGKDGGYDAVARWIEELDVPVRLLTWGESAVWP
jgi:serine protease AprX